MNLFFFFLFLTVPIHEGIVILAEDQHLGLYMTGKSCVGISIRWSTKGGKTASQMPLLARYLVLPCVPAFYCSPPEWPKGRVHVPLAAYLHGGADNIPGYVVHESPSHVLLFLLLGVGGLTGGIPPSHWPRRRILGDPNRAVDVNKGFTS